MVIQNKRKLLNRLAKAYPNPSTELLFTSPYELVVAVMLSAQCTDKKVNQVTPALFKRYPDFQSLAKAKLSELQTLIKPINYYLTKSKHLIAAAKVITEQFGGKIPETREALMKCPGIGQKTANVVLGELGHAKTFPVDTHVFRVSRRLGLASGKTVQEVEEELMQEFDAKYWHNLHHWLILHGRRVCKAPRPLCRECSLAEICPSYLIFVED
ncbi:MAG: endonuclease III [Deltaproteobacteria bacterium]|nr:endonuclease III [Deltaproteobacteria bacterium]